LARECIHDRVREYKSMPFSDLIDLSIDQVIMRCIFTSVAFAVSLLPMAIWGLPHGGGPF